MPLDDRLRSGLRSIADEVDPDVDRSLERTLATRPPSPTRRATTVLAYTAAAALGIAVVGLGSSVLADRFGADTSPSADPNSVSPTASVDACPHPDGGSCAGVLEPGVRRTLEFIPPFVYDIPDEAQIAWDNPEDLPGTFTLHPAGPETDAIFFFRDVRVLSPGCDPHFDEDIGNASADIAAWLVANPNLTATAPEPVTVGGLAGVLVDIAASGAYATDCPNDQDTYPAGVPIVPLFAGAGSGDLTWYVGGTERMRLYLLDLPGGGNLVISIDAIAGDFDTLLEISLPVIHSIGFDPAYY
jgi:hypothetical protein